MSYIMKRFKAAALAAALAFALGGAAAAAGPADLDILKLPEWQVTSSPYGGKLLLSDSPEMVAADGILYQDKVAGNVRLFFHHVNATAVPKRLAVLLENAGPEAATVTVHQYGVGGPGYDWMAVGKAAQEAYLDGGELYVAEVPAGGAATLSAALQGAVVKPNMLVNGIFDFIADRPVTVKVMMLPTDADIRKFARAARVLPPDEQKLRGTFEGKDRMLVPMKVYDPQTDGPVALTLADNALDRYVTGIDATTGEKVLNYGNYGVVYKLFLPSGGRGMTAYYLNPRGGDYAGALGVKYRHADAPPVPTPAGRTGFGHDKLTDFAPVGMFANGESLWLTFSPPGASNLPVKLVIVPEKRGTGI
ncbi:copper amine oxidase [Anaeroselena agilis]|uniref:Copper amine oxidase n=1 Tax=Anaeroselena agilis TaxID=3063788 RepID=A0ABU3P4T6_9FIRM|nr:copper amine oxidase [Selenomonadales bacterium 4137-cl]